MITYDEIQGIYRTEKRSPNSLGKMGDNFYPEVSELLLQLDESHRSEISVIMKEILQLRQNKILRLATRTGESSPPENMILAERELYVGIKNLLENYEGILLRREVKEKAAEPAQRAETGAGIEKVKLRILRQMPSIIGSDLVHYGPFKEDEIVELPKDIAGIMLEHGIAEEA